MIKNVEDFLNDEAKDTVFSIADFKKKYGSKTPGLLVGKFISKSPHFEGQEALTFALGTMMADLAFALENEK